MSLELLEILIEAYCQDCAWSNQVADLFGYEWDNEGSALRSWVTSYFRDTYGEGAVVWLNFFQNTGALECCRHGQKHTISSAKEFAQFLEEESRYVEAQVYTPDEIIVKKMENDNDN